MVFSPGVDLSGPLPLLTQAVKRLWVQCLLVVDELCVFLF